MNIELRRTVDLSAPVLPEVMPAPLYEGESNAHTFIISAEKNGEDHALSGSVVAFFDRPDGVPIRVNGRTEDGKAYVTLSHECYKVNGRFFLRIMLLNGEMQVVIYSADGRMRKKAYGEMIDGGSTPGDSIIPPGGITQETDPTVPAWAKQPNKPTYTAEEVGALPASTKIPTKTSDLTNDSEFIKDETDPTVPAWAKQPNKPTYTADEVGALPASTKIPAKSSDLTNDSGFINKAVNDLVNYYAKSESYTRVEIDQKISAIPKFSIAVVDSLPSSGVSETTVYLLKSGEGSDLYTEFINVNGTWEILGSQRVDLTGYATETWTLEKLNAYQPKGDYAMKSEIPSKLSELTGDASNRTVTDAEKAAWNGKSNFSGAYNDLTGKPTIPTVPTKVSAFENDAHYLVEKDIEGKLDKTELPNAINEALAQAKESGEFDGEDGVSPLVTVGTIAGGHRITIKDQDGTKTVDVLDGTKGSDGRGIKTIARTAGIGSSGTIDTYTITYTDNTTSTFGVYNGKDGNKGDPGYTPVKLIDYWTPEDQESIVQDVIAALGTPVFGTVDENKHITLSGHLANGTYTMSFEDTDGFKTDICTIKKGSSYTNQLAYALGSDGSVYNGTGYRDGYRITNSATEIADDNYVSATTGYFATGYIKYGYTQAMACTPFYIKGVDLDTLTDNTRAMLFNTISDTTTTFYPKSVKFTVTDTTGIDVEKLGNQYYSLTPRADFYKQTNQPVDKINYIRFSMPGTGAGVIITVNEPIE